MISEGALRSLKLQKDFPTSIIEDITKPVLTARADLDFANVTGRAQALPIFSFVYFI